MGTVLLVSSILLWIVLLFNLLITFRLVQMVAPDVWAKNIPRLKSGQLAPAFEIKTMEGETITLASFSGKPLMLTFISLYCSSCLLKMPDFRTLELQTRQAGMQLGVACIADSGKVLAFVNEFGLTAPVWVVARENPIWKDYKVNSTPFYCLIDERSRVQAAGPLDFNLETLVKVWKVNGY
ncbi:MAG: redoxin family protein [Anaerolineales bacterium]